jgi:hypothetical protein
VRSASGADSAPYYYQSSNVRDAHRELFGRGLERLNVELSDRDSDE